MSPNRYRVDADTGCWVWTGPRKGQGYACLRVDGVNYRAHRWFYERYIGPIPEGLDVHHKCGVRLCVNPAHLQAVTRKEHARLHPHTGGGGGGGRGPRPGANGRALTLSDVRTIRASSERSVDLAVRFGVSKRHINRVRSREQWQVPDEMLEAA